MAELREIEQEAMDQQADAADITLEVEDHKEQAEELAEAVAHIKEAQKSLESEGLRAALQDAQEAQQATEARLGELRERREGMLRENERMQEQCQEAGRRKREALEKMPLLRRGTRSGRPEADVASPFYERMQSELGEDLRRTEDAEMDLGAVRRQLDNLDI